MRTPLKLRYLLFMQLVALFDLISFAPAWPADIVGIWPLETNISDLTGQNPDGMIGSQAKFNPVSKQGLSGASSFSGVKNVLFRVSRVAVRTI